MSYTLKLCESSPPTACGPGTAVCAQTLGTDTKKSVGEYRFTPRGSEVRLHHIFYGPGVVASWLPVRERYRMKKIKIETVVVGKFE